MLLNKESAVKFVTGIEPATTRCTSIAIDCSSGRLRGLGGHNVLVPGQQRSEVHGGDPLCEPPSSATPSRAAIAKKAGTDSTLPQPPVRGPHQANGPNGLTPIQADQPNGRTPIQAACAHNANTAQARSPTNTVTTVGPARPGG